MVVYIYYITAAGNSISSCQGNWYGTERTGGTAYPSLTKLHQPGHSSPASQASRRVGPALLPSATIGVMYGLSLLCFRTR